MITQDSSSRLIYTKGVGDVVEAYSTKLGVGSFGVNGGKCNYLMRLELAKEGHPELTGNKLDLRVVDTHLNIYGNKKGKLIPFEKLVSECSKVPSVRAKRDVPAIFRNILFEGFNWNANMLIVSNFSGYWGGSEFVDERRRLVQSIISGASGGFGSHFDEEKTYAPIVQQAFKEIADEL